MRGQLSRHVLLAAALAVVEQDIPTRERIRQKPKKFKPKKKERTK